MSREHTRIMKVEGLEGGAWSRDLCGRPQEPPLHKGWVGIAV
jgi:hypothetical protein